MFLLFKVETTGLPKKVGNVYPNYTEFSNYSSARILSITWCLLKNLTKDDISKAVCNRFYRKWPCVAGIEYHGITQELCDNEGKPFKEIIEVFGKDLAQTKMILGYNVMFDINILLAELHLIESKDEISILKGLIDTRKVRCLMEMTKGICKIPTPKRGVYKSPTLDETFKYYYKIDDPDMQNIQKIQKYLMILSAMCSN